MDLSGGDLVEDVFCRNFGEIAILNDWESYFFDGLSTLLYSTLKENFARFFLYVIIPSVFLLFQIFLSSPQNNGSHHTSFVVFTTGILLVRLPCAITGKYKLRVQLRHRDKFLLALTLRRLCFRLLSSPWRPVSSWNLVR